MFPVGYEELRKRFVDLCLTGLPERLERERKNNAPSDLDYFCADWRIREVAISGMVFYFTTRRLAMRTPENTMHWVGEFLVAINVKTKKITCEGSEIMKYGADFTSVAYHPHVYGTKVPCFGETGSLKLSEWFGDGKIAHVAFYILEFLCLARGVNHFYAPSNWTQLTLDEVEAWKQQQ